MSAISSRGKKTGLGAVAGAPNPRGSGFPAAAALIAAVVAVSFPRALFAQTCPEPKAADFRKVALVQSGMAQPIDLGVTSDGRVFIAEMQTGNIRLYQPGVAGTTIVGTVPNISYVSQCDGLVGLELDPRFMQNGWLYVDYSRKVNGVARLFLSRLTFANGRVDMASEKILLSFERHEPRSHGGGGLAFDAQGNLYLSTGDNTTPSGSDGYGAFDIRDSALDDERSSANTNDLRGKVLRIHPEADGSYSIPAGNLWEAIQPALSLSEAAKVRKEIFAMGFRNPFRIAAGWDGNLYIADVGPVAASDNPARGPAGFDELDVATRAGFFGYPYCMADNRGYNRIAGISGTNVTYGTPYDCAKAIDNNSPFNTGLKTLPAPVPASVWYQAGHKDFPEMGSGPETAVMGPMYRYDPNLVSKVKFPPQFHGRLIFSDWSRGTHVTVAFPGPGKAARLTAFNVSDNSLDKSDVAYEFGPEGALYVLQYSAFAYADNNSALSRVEYTGVVDPACFPAGTEVRKGRRPADRLSIRLDPDSEWQLPREASGADAFDASGKKLWTYHRKNENPESMRLPFPHGAAGGLIRFRYFSDSE